MTHEIVTLTDEMVTEMARKFACTEEYVREQYAVVAAQGVEVAMQEILGEITAIEDDIHAAADAALIWVGRTDPIERLTDIRDYYEDGVTAVDIDQLDRADLFLKITIAVYLLAEARAQIAALLDGSHRTGVNHD